MHAIPVYLKHDGTVNADGTSSVDRVAAVIKSNVTI